MDKDTPNAVRKIAKNAGKRATDGISDGQRALQGDTTEDDVRESNKNSQEAGQDAVDTATEAAKKELEDKGLHIRDTIEKDVADLAEQVRKAAPEAAKPFKVLYLKIAAQVAAATAAIALVITQIVGGNQVGHDVQTHVDQTNQQIEADQLMMQVQMNQTEFTHLLNGLNPASFPAAPPQPEPGSFGAVVPPPEVMLPAAVQMIAAQPALATITLPQQAEQKVQTTLGQVYRLVPGARDRIDTYAGGHQGTGIHGTIDVVAPWGGGPTISIGF